MGGMAPEYFKQCLRPREAEHYHEGVFMRNRAGWEQARLIVSPWQGKDAKPIVFPWESDAYTPPTEDEIKDVQLWADAILAQKNMKHG